MRLKQGKIAVAMAEQGYTAQGLAKKIGISPTTLTGIRYGRPCRVKTALLVTKALGLDLASIVEEW